MTISVDLVIPVLNEQETLEQNINKILDYVKNNLNKEYRSHIIIADNGSTDSTQQIGKNLEELHKDEIYYYSVKKKGVGRALKAVWSSSESSIVGYMDLDIATDLNHLPEALGALTNNDYDMVYGTRLHKASQVHGRTFKREITSRAFNFIVRKYLGVTFSDGMCGFKFLKAEKLPQILTNGAKSDEWFFCTEILVVSEWLGLNIYELPIKWTDDSNSKVKITNLIIENLKAMRQLKLGKKEL